MPSEDQDKEICYRGRAFDVAKVRVHLPDKRRRTYDLVVHGDAVTILPVSAQREIYFVSQYRVGAGQTVLELPAGVIDGSETPLVCAQREVREEIGLAARRLQLLGGFYQTPGYSDEYMSVFLASDLYPAALAPDADEFLNVSVLSIEETYHRAFSGGFQDAKTLAALLLAEPLIRSSDHGKP